MRGRGGIALIIPIIIGLITVASLYFGSEEQTVPITGRSQKVALTDEQQMSLGKQVYDETLQTEASKIVTSGPQYEMVRRVAQRIVNVADDDKSAFEWEVTLIDEPIVNAYCLPGGKIVVYTGILQAAGNDAQLATVMAHEVAHAIAEHGAERMLQQQISSAAVQSAAGALASNPEQFQQVAALLGAGAQVGLTLPWGRGQESEADHIGLIYMARAGYDPHEAVTFWQNMDKLSGGQAPPEYLSTHPSGETRIRQIQEWMPEALEEYEGR